MRTSKFIRWLFVGTAALVLLFLLLRPVSMDNSTSTVLLDKDSRLLSASVAADGMWRFPQADSVPYKFKTCLLQFEDAYFMYHFGVNPISVFRALWQNIKSSEVISGASTITMQLVRLSRSGRSRTYKEKLVEMVLAIRTELSYSKTEILAMYASNAPFGGNVVGVDAAAWRYYGIPANDLSWAEAACLAVLPNAPGLVFPGRNQNQLIEKRNKLLLKLRNNGFIDDETYRLSLLEPAPNEANLIPRKAPHLLTRCINGGYRGKILRSTVDGEMQQEVQRIVLGHYGRLVSNGIRNAAVMVAENSTGEIVAYIGNVLSSNPEYSSMVDVICAKRSYGSLLKPFLYGAMLSEGLILPRQLVNDIPVSFGGFTPENFSLSYDGMVPANEAVARSLNVPAVNMLQEYGVEKFCNNLKSMGIESIDRTPDYYGLSIILGGAEATMWELAAAYSALSLRAQGDSLATTYFHFIADGQGERQHGVNCQNIGVGAAYLTLEALTQATRPDESGTMRHFVSTQKIAWKTGTSRGFRDAWAIGVTPKYTVSVWVGNADGEGRAGLVGVAAAAPILFDAFAVLPKCDWYQKPTYDLQTVQTCTLSGFLASPNCTDTTFDEVPRGVIKSSVCKYHHRIFVDRESGKRVSLACAKPNRIVAKNWFVLPPVQEWFYSKNHWEYKHLPQFREGCSELTEGIINMDLIYPYAGADIYIPQNAKNTRSESVWRATHRNPQAIIYWHLNETFLGSTTGRHQMLVSPTPGQYTLTLVDDRGEILKRRIRILGTN